MRKPRRITPPAVTPVSVEDCRKQLRVDFDDDDSVLQAMIEAAVSHLDARTGILGRCMISQVWVQEMDDWPCGREIRLPYLDVSQVSIEYAHADGTQHTLPADSYFLRHDDLSSYIEIRRGVDLPRLDYNAETPVTVTLTAGYGDAPANVPAGLRHAMLMLIGHWYENRENTSERESKPLPLAFSALVAPHRVLSF